jgi:hypothetical protein
MMLSRASIEGCTNLNWSADSVTKLRIPRGIGIEIRADGDGFVDFW